MATVDVYLEYARRLVSVFHAQNVAPLAGPDWDHIYTPALHDWQGAKVGLLSNGWELARALEAGGYSPPSVLLLINLIEQDGTHGLPSGEISCWAETKVELQRYSLQAEGSGALPQPAGTAERVDRMSTSPLADLDALITQLKDEALAEACAVGDERKEIRSRRLKDSGHHYQQIQSLSLSRCAQCATAGLAMHDAETGLQEAEGLATDLLHYRAGAAQGEEDGRVEELVWRYRSVIERLLRLRAWVEGQSPTNAIGARPGECEQAEGIGGASDPAEAEQPERAANRRRKGRGRPADTDAKADKRIYDAWSTRQYKTYAALAQKLHTTKRTVELAIGRHGKRLKRSKQNRCES